MLGPVLIRKEERKIFRVPACQKGKDQTPGSGISPKHRGRPKDLKWTGERNQLSSSPQSLLATNAGACVKKWRQKNKKK